MVNKGQNTGTCLAPGTVLHGAAYCYKIIQTLGQGTFGITYLAEACDSTAVNDEATAMYVTVKEFFISKINGRNGTAVTASDDGGYFDHYKRRFVKEAQNLESLHHNNIVKVAEAFESNNTAYYVMEFIDGETLSQYIARRGAVDERRAVALTLEIADALAYMHSRNMLHLDIKPSNVMLRDGHAVLIDFGLSKQYDDKGEPESSTSIGLGTPGYAPVEQANYHEHCGLPATLDIYALGATMMKMLTGIEQMPTASEVLNDGFPTILFRQKGVSAQLTTVVQKAMSPLKKDRYQTVNELKAALLACGSARQGGENTMFEQNGNNGRRTHVGSDNGNDGNNNGSSARANATAQYQGGTAQRQGGNTQHLGGTAQRQGDNSVPGGSNEDIIYKKTKALVWLIAEWLLAFFMLGSSGDVAPDKDGVKLMLLYPVLCVALLWWLIKNRHRLSVSLLKKLRWVITALVIVNTLLLGAWNRSLTEAYFFLSMFLAPVSAYLIMLRKNDGNGHHV